MEDPSNNKSRLSMSLSEVMTSTLYTIFYDQTAEEAAKAMLDNRAGSLIVKPRENELKPIGIITERDIVTRVVAQGKNPKKTIVDNIATKPVVTAAPTMDITKAMELMTKLNIRRIVIVEENHMVGIVTYRDLLRIAPGLLEIAMEYEKIGFGRSREEVDEYLEEEYDDDSELENPDLSAGYYCNQCGEYCEDSPLYDSEDQQVCGDCLELEND
jgi:CBS domain-containing protein